MSRLWVCQLAATAIADEEVAEGDKRLTGDSGEYRRNKPGCGGSPSRPVSPVAKVIDRLREPENGR